MSEDTYNGWTNYPTWAVNLWLSNNEGLYNGALAVAQHADDYSRSQIAGAFKDWVTEDLAPDLGATFAADLLGYALDCVNWYEIADAWIEMAAEQIEA